MPLSKKQIDTISKRLDERYATLRREVRQALEESENQQYVELINREPADVGDQSVGDALADLNLAIVDRHVREMRAIDTARERMRDGTFGICTNCGQDIEYERLLAYPIAERCVVCQDQYEKTYSHAATPTL